MTKLLIIVGMTAGGSLGWWLGERFGLLAAFIASGAGSIAGVYIGWLAAQKLSE
ncbi:hypothetical protein GX586_04500 [bacterium]|nr:hypothetical protein [bacterium]